MPQTLLPVAQGFEAPLIKSKGEGVSRPACPSASAPQTPLGWQVRELDSAMRKLIQPEGSWYSRPIAQRSAGWHCRNPGARDHPQPCTALLARTKLNLRPPPGHVKSIQCILSAPPLKAPSRLLQTRTTLAGLPPLPPQSHAQVSATMVRDLSETDLLPPSAGTQSNPEKGLGHTP